jgi:hypothetical protein
MHWIAGIITALGLVAICECVVATRRDLGVFYEYYDSRKEDL